MIGPLATINLAGIDHWRMLTTDDPVVADVESAVARRLIEMRMDHEATRDANLAIRIANAIVKSQGG